MNTSRRSMTNMSSNLIITCPVCGYTFKNDNFGLKKKKFICPMCKHQFKDPNIPPDRLDEFMI
jgi:rubrerythrin